MIVLPTAYVGKPYKHHLQSGVSLVGSLPSGLQFKDNCISGVPTASVTAMLTLEYAEEKFPAVLTALKAFDLVDNNSGTQAEFVRQLQEEVARRKVWSVGIPSLTSQTLLELMGTMAAFFHAKIEKAKADAFQDTAVSVQAKRSIALMKGIRLNRKVSAQCSALLTTPKDVTLAAFTVFNSGVTSLFLANETRLKAGVPTKVILHEGHIHELCTAGLGTPHQTFVIPEDNFVVSDIHVQVQVDGVKLHRTLNGLWHHRGVLAFDDTTMADGRARFAFGTSVYGGVPARGSNVVITYATTKGAQGNKSLKGTAVTSGSVRGTIESDLSNGIDEKSPAAYKYLDSFGTFGSALTKAQIETVTRSYPGISDCVIIREPQLSIVYRTQTDWDAPSIEKFKAYIDEVVAYQPLSLVQATAKPVDVFLQISTNANFVPSVSKSLLEQAIKNLFVSQMSIGSTVYDADIVAVVKSVEGVTTLKGALTFEAAPHEYLELNELVLLYE